MKKAARIDSARPVAEHAPDLAADEAVVAAVLAGTRELGQS